MDHSAALLELSSGMPVIYGGDRIAYVSEELATAFQPGDKLLVVQTTGDLLRIPAEVSDKTKSAVAVAYEAFAGMSGVSDEDVSRFFEEFALRLGDPEAWSEIAAANAADVAQAQARGRSTTRLAAGEKMRRGMVEGLRAWRDMPGLSGRVVERAQHDGWSAEQLMAPLGVVGFVFEGRPNVFADAAGVLRSGNTVVFRIGSDALGTARAIVAHALAPALEAAGLPAGAATLVDSADRAAGWAMFSDPRLALAVARGSGRAVEQLGSVARQSGVPVSLHGTGGAWIVADASADPHRLERAVFHSLDRKVCNTLNTVCLPQDRPELADAFLRGITAAGERLGHGFKLHIVRGDERVVPADFFTTVTEVRRAEGDVTEPIAEPLDIDALGHEWEWEQTPEVTVKLVATTEEAVALFNKYSPQFVASLITSAEDLAERFYRSVNAPFVGDGFTRWVDGQYTLGRPELGLSNWQTGRLFARGAILSGDGVFTVRTRVRQTDPEIGR
ncbi:MAG: aldehyde dehydrogenase family protein [Capsulimonas sp.]|uniref:aldehyde dehydrogenase family protein n=1 Tax=Capsulimonas sp. TaxID=2494211 RepID=UPI003264B5CE